MIHGEARAVRKPSIRISIERPERTNGVSIRADVLAAECCLKLKYQRRYLNVPPESIECEWIKMPDVSSLHASSVISHTLTHTRSDCFLIPVISGVTAVCVTTDDSNFVIAF